MSGKRKKMCHLFSVAQLLGLFSAITFIFDVQGMDINILATPASQNAVPIAAGQERSAEVAAKAPLVDTGRQLEEERGQDSKVRKMVSKLSCGLLSKRSKEQQKRVNAAYHAHACTLANRFCDAQEKLLVLPHESDITGLHDAVAQLIVAYDELSAFYADDSSARDSVTRAQQDLEIYANMVDALRPMPELIANSAKPEELLPSLSEALASVPVAVKRGRRGLSDGLVKKAQEVLHYLGWWHSYLGSTHRVVLPTEQQRAAARNAAQSARDLVRYCGVELPSGTEERFMALHEEFYLVRELLCYHDRAYGFQRGVVQLDSEAFRTLAPTAAAFFQRHFESVCARAGVEPDMILTLISFGNHGGKLNYHFNAAAGSIWGRGVLMIAEGSLELALLEPAAFEELLAHELGHIACDHGMRQVSQAGEFQADLFASRTIGRQAVRHNLLLGGLAQEIFAALERWMYYDQCYLRVTLAVLLARKNVHKLSGITVELATCIQHGVWALRRALGCERNLGFCIDLKNERVVRALFDKLQEVILRYAEAAAPDYQGVEKRTLFKGLYAHGLYLLPPQNHPIAPLRIALATRGWNDEPQQTAFGGVVQMLNRSELTIPHAYFWKN